MEEWQLGSQNSGMYNQLVLAKENVLFLVKTYQRGISGCFVTVYVKPASTRNVVF